MGGECIGVVAHKGGVDPAVPVLRVHVAPRLARQVHLRDLQVQAAFAGVELTAGARQVSADPGAAGKRAAGGIVDAVQVNAQALQGLRFQAQLRGLLAVDGDEGQGFAPDPLAVEVNVSAVAAGQHHVAVVEFGNVDVHAGRATGKEGRVELDLFCTVDANRIGAAAQQQAGQHTFQTGPAYGAGWPVHTHFYVFQNRGWPTVGKGSPCPIEWALIEGVR